MTSHITVRQQAFTLVELSIVLVIIGIIVGGVLVGQSLIHAAELRKIVTEFDRYRTAIHTFQGKYGGLPGDFAKATQHWGVLSGSCSTTPSTTVTCDGNGNGMIEYSSSSYESGRAWQQLSNAGLIAGTYNGALQNSSYQPNQNVPAAPIKGGVWNLFYTDSAFPWVTSRNTHVLSLGSINDNRASPVWQGRWHNPLLSALDQYSIDSKIDDGKPFVGKVTDMFNASYSPNCTNSNTDETGAVYMTTNEDVACILIMAF